MPSKKGGKALSDLPPFDHSPLRLLLRSGVDFGGVLDVAFGHTAFRIARVLALPRIVAKGIAGTVAVVQGIYQQADLATMSRVRDAFDPSGLCNPCKIFPTPGRCMSEHGKLRASAGW